jgi:hypothetical protein
MNESVSYRYRTNINRADNDIFNRSLYQRNSPNANTSQNICLTEGNLETLKVFLVSYIVFKYLYKKRFKIDKSFK